MNDPSRPRREPCPSCGSLKYPWKDCASCMPAEAERRVRSVDPVDPSSTDGGTVTIPWWLVAVSCPVWLPLFLLARACVVLRPMGAAIYGILPGWGRAYLSRLGKRASDGIAVAIALVVICLPPAVVGWGFGSLLRSPLSDATDRADGGGNVDAWVAATSAVRRDLKSPASADFPAYSRQHVTDLGGGRYRVRAYVDAANSFGATRRTEFLCTVRSESGDWVLESLVFAE